MSLLEWCKLLGDRKGNHFWATVVADPARFKTDLLGELRISEPELDRYVDEMRRYRNKFLAHLDDLAVMDIPLLDQAYAAVEFYHRYVVQHEAAAGDLAGLPSDLPAYYRQCCDEAKAIYDRCPI